MARRPKTARRMRTQHCADNADLQDLVHFDGIVSRVDQPPRFHSKEARHQGARPVHQVFAGTLANFGRRCVALAFLLERNHFLEFGEFLIDHLIERR